MSCDTNTCACDTPASADAATRPSYRRPAYTVNETADAFEVAVFVPGATREGVAIELADDQLSVTARRTATATADWRPLHREIAEEDFRLTLRVNVSVNAANITATVTDGVLRLTLPKAEEVKPRRIQVS
jgi:HSP20 family protein